MNRQSVIALGLVAVALLAYIIVYERHTLSTGALEGRGLVLHQGDQR